MGTATDASVSEVAVSVASVQASDASADKLGTTSDSIMDTPASSLVLFAVSST